MYERIWVHFKQLLCHALGKTWASTDSSILGRSKDWLPLAIQRQWYLCIFLKEKYATFSSVPSLQSTSWSHIHSANTHSPLFGHFISPSAHCRDQATGQPSSSEWSRQSRFPSQCREEDMHWPFSHWKSEELHFSWTEKGNALGKGSDNSEATQGLEKYFQDSPEFCYHHGN